MKALKLIGAAAAAVIIVVLLGLVIGVPSGFMTSAIQARIERQTGYRMTVAGTTRIGIWPSLNVTLNDVTLQDPDDRTDRDRLTIGSLQADVTLASVWSGHPHVTEVVVARPVLSVPLLRERNTAPDGASKGVTPANKAGAEPPTIDRIIVTDGAIVFANLRDRVEDRIEGINADTVIDADRSFNVAGRAHAGAHPLSFNIKAAPPAAQPESQQLLPLELKFEAPGLLQGPLTARAEVRLNGAVVMINGASGTLGDGAFNGWASIDLASKPLVKLDLDFQRLDIATSPSRPATGPRPWSDAGFDLTGLNYVDLQAKLSAAALNIGEVHLAPVALDAALTGGVVKCRFSNLGAYGGQASGELTIDASQAAPRYALSGDLAGVRALPLLKTTADFDKLDGKLQARLALTSTGASQRAILSNLDGTVSAAFQGGAIRGLNLARMIRALTSGTLTGWQQSQEQATDLTELTASFRIDNGKATTSDLHLVGPLVRVTGGGTVDIGAQSLALRVEPKLVLTTEGQGRAGNPVGLGIPVVVDGPWADPNIYPDINGILDHPEAAYAKLKEMGKGLFGPNGALGGLDGNGSTGGNAGGESSGAFGETLGNLIQQGLSHSRTSPSPSPAPADPAPGETSPAAPADSSPLSDTLKQLFNR